MIIPRRGQDYSLAALVAVKQALYSGGAPDPELADARIVLDALAASPEFAGGQHVLVGHPTAEQAEHLKRMIADFQSVPPSVTVDCSAWLPVATAPRDGSWFVTYTPGVHPDASYDLARFDLELDDFCKVGCGFQYVERWFPLPPV